MYSSSITHTLPPFTTKLQRLICNLKIVLTWRGYYSSWYWNLISGMRYFMQRLLFLPLIFGSRDRDLFDNVEHKFARSLLLTYNFSQVFLLCFFVCACVCYCALCELVCNLFLNSTCKENQKWKLVGVKNIDLYCVKLVAQLFKVGAGSGKAGLKGCYRTTH